MSLFSLGRLFKEAAQLFSPLQTPTDSQQQQQGNLQRFGIFGFNNYANGNTAKANEPLLQVSNTLAASTPNETSSITPRRGEGVVRDGSYVGKVKPQDIGKDNWYGKDTSSADIAKAGMKRAVINAGIAATDDEATRIVDRMNVTGANYDVQEARSAQKTRVEINSGHLQTRSWLKDHTDGDGQFTVHVSKEQMNQMKQIGSELGIQASAPKPPIEELSTEVGVLGTTTTMTRVIPQLPKVINPVTIGIGLGIAGGVALGDKFEDIVVEDARLRRKENTMPQLTPPTLHMEDAGEAPPFARPTDTAERPKPNIDLPTAPTDLVTTGQATPQTNPQVQPQAQPQAKPETAIDSLPQPYTPDVPTNAPQQKPPRKIDPRLIPPTVIGGTAISKTILDKANGDNQTTVTPPPEFTKASDPAFDVSHLELQQVAPGSTDLSRAVIDYRIQNKVSIYKNVAVFEYKDSKGDPQLKIFESSEGGQHSERRIADWMRENNIKPEQVTRVYTELEPCSTRNSFCKQYLAKNTPQAKVSYSFEYGDNKPSKQRGVKELKRYSQDLLKGNKYAQPGQLNQ